MISNVLIVGANFKNKGAQSMLFITVDELKKRIPDCEIYFGGTDVLGENIYSFKELYYSRWAKHLVLSRYKILEVIKCILIDCIKFTVGKRDNLWRFMEVSQKIEKIDCIIDISGFNLGEKWKKQIQESYLDNIRIAKKYNIPMFVMPQSFGGFNYSPKLNYILDEIRELLCYPEIIFARESQGYEALVNNFGLSNVKQSTDLVLQNNGVDLSHIYKKWDAINTPDISPDSIGVIPNMQCFNHGDKEKNMELYDMIINHLLDVGKKIYIFRHSKEDLPICRAIAKLFIHKNVILLENDFSCFEYDQFVRKFDFIICSRYHGIVHAYRNYIPCILLGWEIKYIELAKKVGQGAYAFDITKSTDETSLILNAVDNLSANLESEKKTIKKNVIEIQKENCFSYITEWIKLNE